MNRILVLTLAFVFVLTTRAAAEPIEITAQAKAANAEFLLRATPPTTPAAICLVDTGVNANPDTTGVIARASLYGLDGSDQSPSLHGTQMAMLIGAPSNGFGMVGLWPAARIVSMHASLPGQETTIPDAYSTGIDDCTTTAPTHQTKVILVASASESPLTGPERAFLDDAVRRARSRGINVVVAGGNHDGRPIGSPANTPGAFSVGSVDTATAAACATSASGARLLAPGCSIDGADPISGQPTTNQQGTSAAAALVATGLAALRTWRPDLTVDAAEQLINDSAVTVAAGRKLDIGAAFIAAGLQGVAQPPAPAPTPTPSPAPPPPIGKPKLVKPRVTAQLRKRVLTVRSSNRPRGARMQVRVYSRDSKRRYHRIASRTVNAATVRFRVKRWARVRVQFSDPSGARQTSSTAIVTKR